MQFAGLLILGLIVGYILGRRKSAFTALPPEVQEKETLALALKLAAEDNLQSAIQVLKRFIAVNPEAQTIYMVLGAFYRRVKEFERAIRIHQNVYHSPLSSQDQKLDALTELAMDYLAMKDQQKATTILEQILAEHPSRLKTSRYLGLIYAQLGEWEKAYSHIHKVMKRQSHWDLKTLAAIQTEVGKAALADKNYRKALDCFENAKELDSSLPLAWKGLAETYLAKNNPKKTIELMTQALLALPEQSQHFWPTLRDALYAQKKYEAYEGMLRQRLNEAPTDLAATMALAEHLERNNQHTDAMRIVENAMVIAAENLQLQQFFLRNLRKTSAALAEKQAFDLLMKLDFSPESPEAQHLRLFQSELLSIVEEEG